MGTWQQQQREYFVTANRNERQKKKRNGIQNGMSDKVNEGTIVRLCKQYVLSCVFDERFI